MYIFYIKLFLFIYYFVYDNIESVEDFYYVMFVDKNCYILYWCRVDFNIF